MDDHPVDGDETGVPSFEALAPLLDRIARLGERELPEPVTVEVRGWDDGDFRAVAYHAHGTDPDSGVGARQVVTYVEETESFVYRFVEEADGSSTVLNERVLETFPAPW
jgi:hypothetical protein